MAQSDSMTDAKKMKKNIVRRPVVEKEMTLCEHLPPLLQRIYAGRGITSGRELERDFSALLSFETLAHREKAVDCLVRALKQRQHIMIIGDYDVDGATSSALAVTALRLFGAEQVSYLVPNRFEYGYGLTPDIVSVAAEKNPDLIVTVDNGM